MENNTVIKQITVNHGSLIISLDFEMMWGMHDVATKDGYGQSHIKNVPEVIDRLLDLFKVYGVHATFATVGMIMCGGKEELLSDIPNSLPSYDNKTCSPYGKVMAEIQPSEEPLFFQKAVVKKLRDAEGIEVGTHTYCHYYCWEQGQTIDQFDTDIQKAVEVAHRNGIEIRSIVFPRNQVSEEHLKVCAKYGITSYRGNAAKYFTHTQSRLRYLQNRILRMLDAYLNVGGLASTPYTSINLNEKPLNLRASRFLRPYSHNLAFLNGMRLNRIKREMIHAAQYNEIYHLWWHPHNFGAILRSADAFGVDGVIIKSRNQVPLNMTVAKVSTGAIEYVKVAEVNNIVSAINKLKENGFWIYTADGSGKDNYETLDYSGPTALVVGSEGHGASRLVMENSDFIIKIPMKGHVNSLNVSVSVGILLSRIVNK